MPTAVDIDFLFPDPSLLSPQRWHGITPESTQTLRKILRDSCKRWHIFSYVRSHNHAMRGALAVWAMDGTASIIEPGCEDYWRQQRRAFKSPGLITEASFEKFLSDEKFYDYYPSFYIGCVRKHGIKKTCEKFIFTREYTASEREVLSRFLSGGMHPMVHVGYGAEFGLPVMLVEGEGLALTSVHGPNISRVFPRSFFNGIWAVTDPTVPRAPSCTPRSTGGNRGAASYTMPRLTSTSAASSDENVHALTILARVIADDTIKQPTDQDELRLVEDTSLEYGYHIHEYVMQWTVDLSKPGEIERKVEELGWLAVVGYGVAGWTWAQEAEPDGREFYADPFQLHFVTAVAFPASILAVTESPQCKVAFLRSCLATMLAQYISRGKPKLDIAGFYRSPLANPFPMPYHGLPTPSEEALPVRENIEAGAPDPWIPLIQSTLVHPDTHLAKAVRTLAWLGSRLGGVPKGTFGSPEVCPEGVIKTEMAGAEGWGELDREKKAVCTGIAKGSDWTRRSPRRPGGGYIQESIWTEGAGARSGLWI